MPNSSHDESMELIEMLHEGKMLSHPVIQRHVDRALHTGDSKPLYDFLEKFPIFTAYAERNIALARYQKLDNPYRPYPDHDEVLEYLTGPMKLGFVNARSDMFGVHSDIFSLPAIMPGRVRAGKSQLMKYMLCQIFRKQRDFNVIIPDLKAEYRNLLPIARHLKLLTKEHIKLNPLEVPNWMTPADHIIFFSKVFIGANWLGDTSKNVLRLTLEDLYRKRGIFDGSQNYPTMRDLYNVVSYQLDSHRSFKYRDILLLLQNRLNPYFLSENFNCRIGLPHDIWRKENMVLEMDTGFTDDMYCFIISYIAGLRYTYNMKKGLIGSILRTLFNIDEGRILFSPHRDTSIFGESYINEIITKTGEFGVGFIVASPETASFSQTVRSISYTKICFPLTDGADKNFIKESFGLDDEQANYVFRLPRFGQAIVRYGGYEKPFLLAVPNFKIKKHLTDEEVEMRMAPFYSEFERNIKRTEIPMDVQIIETVLPAASALLYFLSKEPFTNVSDMTETPGFKSPEDVKKALNWLKDNGFIERQEYHTSKRGRKSAFAVLTQKACAYLDIKGFVGKGNFEHKLYQHFICECHRKEGLDAKIEGRIKGSQKLIDVLAYSKERGYVAYEVTIHFENLLLNIHQDIATGASEVVIVTRDQKEMEKAIKMVSNDLTLNQNLEQVTFSIIADFFT